MDSSPTTPSADSDSPARLCAPFRCLSALQPESRSRRTFAIEYNAPHSVLSLKLSRSNSRPHADMHFIVFDNWLKILPSLGLFTAAVSVAVVLYVLFFYVDFPKIQGIPEIPGGELLAGHLYKLGADHATTAQRWSTQYGWPVFQLRMGYRRAVILNSFGSAREWLVKNQSATIDRPWFYTFHGVVSKTSGKPFVATMA